MFFFLLCNRLATVLNANRIVFIEKGEVVEDGTHEELLALRGRYYQLVLENEPSIAPGANTPETTQKRKIIILFSKINHVHVNWKVIHISR